MKLIGIAALIGRIFYLRTEMRCVDIRQTSAVRALSISIRLEIVDKRYMSSEGTYFYIHCAQPSNRISLFSINRPGIKHIVDVFSYCPRNQ